MGIDLHDIRYARIGTEDLDTSVRFATEILGLELMERDASSAYLRGDNRDHNICYTKGRETGHATGWEMSSIEPYEVSFPDTDYGTFTLNRAIIQKGIDKQLVYYWFEQRGRRMTNDFMAKFAVIYDSWTRGRRDGALVRFVTPVGAEGEEAADARLQAFMAQTLQVLPRYLPE